MLEPIIISYKLTTCQLLILYKYLQTLIILLTILMLHGQTTTKTKCHLVDYHFAFALALHCICICIALHLHLHCIALALHWHCIGIALALHWHCICKHYKPKSDQYIRTPVELGTNSCYPTYNTSAQWQTTTKPNVTWLIAILHLQMQEL